MGEILGFFFNRFVVDFFLAGAKGLLMPRNMGFDETEFSGRPLHVCGRCYGIMHEYYI